MPEQRSLPIQQQHREFTVKVNDREVERSEQLLGVTLSKNVNRISSARLMYLDGSASVSDFPLSNSALFIPGSEIEILAGTDNELTSLFKGIVVSQSLKIRENASPQLVVECRHKAVVLSVGRKNAYFYDQSDSEIIDFILSNAEISGNIEQTDAQHKQLVQYYATDWDFIMMRAEANGKLVYTNSDEIEMKAPDFSGKPVCSLHFGSTILEMDTEIDARNQYAGVKGVAWDSAQQSLLEKDANDPLISGPGNLSSSELSSTVNLEYLRLQHTSISESEAQSWADAFWIKSQLSKVNGRIKCEGIGSVNPGDMVTICGVGERYNGDVFITGVRHDFDLVQGWKTHLQFGNTSSLFADEHIVEAQKAAALVPGINGLQPGIVVSNEDPDGEHRVRVRMPLINNNEDGIWARMASLDAGSSRGFFFRPEIGDEVVLGFMDDDPRYPIILGMLHSSSKEPPLTGSDSNHEKVYQSRSKMKLYFNDDTKVLRIETPAGNKITLSDDEKLLRLEDQNSNKIEMSGDGITIESAKALELKAGTNLKISADSSVEIKSTSSIKMEGNGSVEVKSSGNTTIKGSILMLN